MDTLIQTTQKAAHAVVSTAMQPTPQNATEQQYQSIMGMVYTLVEDGRADELYTAIKNQFPEYYH